ncbi:MAG: Trk family potassium uptake protein [Ruminococcaceae bacterium]|nr:Trk family potassium uptake protein [Oscillospiraceae bacterium]
MFKKLTYTQKIAFSFLVTIFIGAFLLCLPISSKEGQWTPFLDGLFTATSATCVTGLAVVDTFAYWSRFGQVVILCLIQIGGLGFMTLMIAFTMLIRKQVSLHDQLLLRQSTGNNDGGGIPKLLKKVLLGTLLFEGVGVVLLMIRFCGILDFGEGLYYAVFHSVSAFCNAGFDILSGLGSSSLSMFVDDPLVNFTIMFLIVVGGLGFLVWEDILNCRFRFKKFALHTKVVLVTTAILILSGWAVFYFIERGNAFGALSEGEKVMAALFQSVTTRTAGFATVDQAAFSEPSSIVTVILMLIGGSPGSTAGGLKTTTFAVLVVGTFCCARNEEQTVMFKRSIEPNVVREASAIVSIYFAAAIAGAIAISIIEPVSFIRALYETGSAIGTVGLSMGLTPSLGSAARMILILLMYAGRIGGLSFVLALAEKRKRVPLDRPMGKILIG